MKAKLWIALLCLGILAGLVTTFRLYTVGFVLYAKTDILVWTLPLAAYIFFSLTSSGLAFFSSIPVVFGIKRYEVLEKRTVLLETAVLAGGFICLILHLGSPLKVIYFLLSPNPASPLWWIAMLYGVYLIALVASLWKVNTGQVSKPLGILVFVIAIGTSTVLGWLVGMADARPTLNGSFLTIYFPITAFGSGLAAILLFSLASAHFSGTPVTEDRSALYDEIARILSVAIGVTLVLFIWRIIIEGVSSSAVEFAAYRRMLQSLTFHVELWIGLVIPIILLVSPARRRSTSAKVTASVLILVGMLAGRLEFILSGEVMPLGAMAEGMPSFVDYMPTIWEVFIAVFGLSAMLLIYTLGDRYLKLEEASE
jgi:molybdopterin-containing oxidoreductase family membrane subunit